MTGVDTSTFAEQVLGPADRGRVALVDGASSLTYGELADRMRDRTSELGLVDRSVVVLDGDRTMESVVTYLALLGAGHVPLLAGPHRDALAEAWAPGAVVTTSAEGVAIDRRRTDAPPLHPDLALLLSTSGSTGAPKLVRLSHRNLASNARAIVAYLGLTSHDRGITSLPLHYCYGLSVLHSHLAAGASVVLTETSVVDPCFAAAMEDHAVTNLAGVSHTFDMLERAGPERIHVPSLRLLTQAGGRMAPGAVTRWRDRAEGWGVDLFVMYGQTEATARMAYLPPHLAAVRPDAIGVPIPGGSLEVRPLAGRDDGVGELVYRGPNVMLGYATTPADLADGATLTELHTGDLGRFDTEHGVFEVVGRRSRFVKPYGLRIDLDVLEDRLSEGLPEVAVTGDDDVLVVGAPDQDPEDVRQRVHRVTGLPPSIVVVAGDGPLPRTPAGKVDYAALRRSAGPAPVDGPRPEPEPSSVGAVLAQVLGRPTVAPDSTFVSAGGDSLSYVECSLRLERLLGRLPDDWHLRTVAELDATGPCDARPRLDTTVVLRAVSICTVVATHMRLQYFPGGAHLLLAVVGFNLSRFQLTLDHSSDRLRAGLRTVGRVAVPTVLWAAAVLALTDSYGPSTLALVNNYLGPAEHDRGHWHFWFVEAFAQLCLATTLLLAIPSVRRLERRFPYAFPLALLLGALQLRGVDWAGIDDPSNLRFRTHGIAGFFLLGWLIHRSTTVPQRILTTALCVLTVAGFFGLPQREVFIAAGLIALTWFRQVPFPRRAVPVVGTLAAASMWILISHFQIWPHLVRALPTPVAYAGTLLAGVAIWAVVQQASRLGRRIAPPSAPLVRSGLGDERVTPTSTQLHGSGT